VGITILSQFWRASQPHICGRDPPTILLDCSSAATIIGGSRRGLTRPHLYCTPSQYQYNYLLTSHCLLSGCKIVFFFPCQISTNTSLTHRHTRSPRPPLCRSSPSRRIASFLSCKLGEDGWQFYTLFEHGGEHLARPVYIQQALQASNTCRVGLT
jgi:hypothetical protein